MVIPKCTKLISAVFAIVFSFHVFFILPRDMPKIKQIRPTYSTIIRQNQEQVQFDSFIFMDNMLFYISYRKNQPKKHSYYVILSPISEMWMESIIIKLQEGNEL